MFRVGLIGVLAVGCGFEITTAPIDSLPPIDTVDAIDVPMGPPPSCKAILADMPGTASGPYTIDPDGAGPDPSLSVTCDMTTAGGGWTITFLASSNNLAAAPAYTSSSPRLLADATETLVAYRMASGQAAPDHATFALPASWRTAFPLSLPGTDVVTAVSIDGAAPTSANVRFGKDNFNTRCTDPWTPATIYGRFCIVGTSGPFYNGFADTLQDNCGDSTRSWNAVACTDQRFSIAVR